LFEEIHSEIDSKTRAMELIKNTIKDISRKLQDIRQQRYDLDKEEKEFLAEMLKEDLKNKLLIGLLLEELARKIFDEKASSRADFPTDQDELEAKSWEENANGFVEAVWKPAVVEDA